MSKAYYLPAEQTKLRLMSLLATRYLHLEVIQLSWRKHSISVSCPHDNWAESLYQERQRDVFPR